MAAEITFLMGQDDPASGNPFYSLAKKYFQKPGSTVIDAPATGQTLEGVFNSLRALTTIQTTINLVSHASAFGAMNGAITQAMQASGRRYMTADDMQDALANKSLTAPGPRFSVSVRPWRETRVEPLLSSLWTTVSSDCLVTPELAETPMSLRFLWVRMKKSTSWRVMPISICE